MSHKKKSGVYLSWRNTFHDKKRAIAAIVGVAFSVALMFMQFGFLDAAKLGVTMVFQYLDFDLLMTSDKYEFMVEAGTFDKIRLVQAKAVSGVDRVSVFNFGGAHWKNADTEISHTITLMGVDHDSAMVLNNEIKSNLKHVAKENCILLDRLSVSGYGRTAVGMPGQINERSVKIKGFFSMGARFYSEGAAMMSNESFSRLTGRNSRQITLGLIKVDADADVGAVKRKIEKILPKDILIFKRDQIIAQEQAFFIYTKPVGIMFLAGAVVAFAVGAVILFQVLAAEISSRLNEFATLKAMGFKHWFIYGIGIKQGLLYAGFGYSTAFLMACGIFKVVRMASGLPMYLSVELVLMISAMTLAMCLLPGISVLTRIKRADPADIF